MRVPPRSEVISWLAGLLVVVWVVLQAWLLHAHWINPDEGAHLMDARLAMQGLIPGVDFNARQPLYVYAYVPFLHLLGVHYAAGRVMPLVAIILSGWLLFAIGRRLWGVEVGTTAALGLFWAPLMVVDTAVVKTEPLAILLTCLGMYGLVRHLQQRRWWPLWMAAVSMGLAYYVRESSLGGLVAAGLISLSLWRRDRSQQLLRRLGVLAAGSGAVFLTVMSLYATRLSWGQVVMNEGLFPYYKAAAAVQHMAGWKAHAPAAVAPLIGFVTAPSAAIPESAAAPADAVATERLSQSGHATIENLTEAVRLSLPWVLAALMALILWVRPRGRGASTPSGHDTDGLPLTIVVAWLGSFVLLYAYHAIQRGFFQFYFREFLPPMALLLAVVLHHVMAQLGFERWAPWAMPVGIGSGALLFWYQRAAGGRGVLITLLAVAALGGWVWWRAFQHSHRRFMYGSAATAGAFAVYGLTRLLPVGGIPVFVMASVLMTGWVLAVARWITSRRHAGHPWAFAGAALLAASSVWTISQAAPTLGPSYDCVWSAQALQEVARVIRAHSTPEDEVISGAVIWEFQSGRQPFARITHPLGFMGQSTPEMSERIMTRLHERLPRMIVLDGYTERTYLAGVPALETLLRASYRLVHQVTSPVRRPVTVYVLQEQPPMAL